MKNLTITISEEEFTEILNAYHTLQMFLEKMISPNELYQDEFLSGLREAQKEVELGGFKEVKSFVDFVQ